MNLKFINSIYIYLNNKEQDFNDYKEILHKNQNLKNNIKYQKWLENAINYSNSINEKHGSGFVSFINFCNNCCSQAIFEIYECSFIKCKNCHQVICYGCEIEKEIGIEK